MIIVRQFLLSITRQIQACGLVRRSLVATDSMPTKVTVALATWQRTAIQIDALALHTAVGIAGALIVVLARRSVVVLFTLAARGKVFTLARTGLAEVLTLFDVHIGTRPEAIAARPFVSLTQQTQRAVEAFKVFRKVYGIRLGAGKRSKDGS